MKIYNKSEWKKVKLGDIFILQMGKTPLRENKLYWDKGNYNWISISDMNFSEKYISFTKEKITDFAIKKSGIKIIPKNTVIMSFKLSIGKVKIVNEDIYSNEAIMAFIPKEDIFIDENFLYHSLKSVRWNEGINKAVKGLTLNKNLISQKEILLPNLTIQKEIAKNLDSMGNLLELRKKQLNYLKELGKSLFTRMFGDIKTNNKNWEINYWKDVLNIKNGKNQKQVEDINGKYPIYGSGGIIGRSNAYICNENSIIIGRKGNINKPILVKEKFWNVDTAFGLETKRDKISYYYLYYFCLFYDFEIHNKAVTIPSLVKSDLEKIVLPVPPIELQNKFAKKIEKITKLSFEIEEAIKEAENLYNSLISKYFD